MSGFLPANTTLQLGDNSGNIFHQGVLASNVNRTTLLTGTFPTTSTGDSTCHAHYTDASTNALKFLNACASGTGGHEFWVSTSTTAPIQTAKFDINGLTIDKGTGSLVNLPAIIVGQSTQVVFTYPPALDSFGIQYNVFDNPVQVLFNAGVFTTGTTYYARATNAQTLEIRLTTNPLDTPLNCSVFTAGQIPFAYVVSPTTILNSVLNEFLTLQEDANESILTATDLTFNGVSVALKPPVDELIIKQTNLIYQFASPAIYADGRPMIATPSSVINTYAINSWYFINSFASNNKINWYIPPDNGMLVSDILGLYLRFLNLSTTSNDNTMFLTVYTKLQASGNYGSWYHSAITYTLDSSIQPTINTNYTMFMNVSGSCPNPSYYASSLVDMEISSVNPNPRGTYAPTDEILAFAISTNSTSPINSVEFVLQKFGIMTPNGTQEFQFAPLI
jgi:hypothetical protein